MKFTTFSIIASLVLPSAAMPAPQELPEPRPDLLSIMSFYTLDNCTASGNGNGWTLSTGTDTWNSYLKNTNGCQEIRGRPDSPRVDIPSIKPRWLGPGCAVTVYTDTECKEGETAAPFEACVANKNYWKSWALRNCDLTKETPPA